MKTKCHVLVTGGLGFIGSSLVDSFVASGNEVTVVDDCSSNVIDVDELAVGPGTVKFIRSDVTDYLRGQGRHLKADVVVHAACYVGAAGVLEHAGAIVRDSVAAAAEVVEFCLQRDSALVFISSSEVYGRSGILSESMDLRIPPYMNARIEYGIAKLACEAMIVNSGFRGLRAVSLRPFNVVGPRQSRAGGFVLPTFVQQALGGKPLTVFSTGEQKRAFLAVDDFVSAVRWLLRRGISGSEQRFNIGNPLNSVSILELASLVARQAGCDLNTAFTDGKAVYGPRYFEAESVDKLCDIAELNALGWRPTVGLPSIVDLTIEHYSKRRDVRGSDART